jgi:hypothetical protein
VTRDTEETGLPDGVDRELVLEAQAVGAHVFLTWDQLVLDRVAPSDPAIAVVAPRALADALVRGRARADRGHLRCGRPTELLCGSPLGYAKLIARHPHPEAREQMARDYADAGRAVVSALGPTSGRAERWMDGSRRLRWSGWWCFWLGSELRSATPAGRLISGPLVAAGHPVRSQHRLSA